MNNKYKMNFLLYIFPLLISLSVSFGFGYYKTKKHSLFGNKIKTYKMITNDNLDYPCNNEYYGESEDDPLYIVIWKETEKTQNLITEMEKQGLKTIFIPEDVYEYIQLTTDEMPLVYKNEMLLETWFEIYAEIYPM